MVRKFLRKQTLEIIVKLFKISAHDMVGLCFAHTFMSIGLSCKGKR